MIVVDASVAFKWLKSENEPYREKAIMLLSEHLSNKNKILVPRLLFVEIANSLVTKTMTTDETIKDDLEYLFGVNLEVRDPEVGDLVKAARLAKKHKTSVYDMLYAVIAQKHDIILVTADVKFVKVMKFPFVKLISEI